MNPQYREQIIKQLTARGIPATEENILRVASSSSQPQTPQGPSTGMQLAQAGAQIVGQEIGRQGVQAGINAITGTAAATGTTAALAAPTVVSAAPVTTTALAAPTVVSAAPVATTAAGTTAAGTTAGTTAAAGTPIAAPLAAGALQLGLGLGGAYGLYNTVDKSWKYKQTGTDLARTTAKGAASGASIGSAVMPGPGTVIGGIIGAITGLVSGFAGSGKDAHQRIRDLARNRMSELGIYEHTPATKEKFSMGADGGYRLPDGRRSFEIVKGQAEGKQEREYTPEEAQAVGLLSPLGMIVVGGADTEEDKRKAVGNTVGLLYNQLDQNVGEAGVNIDEIRNLYNEAGADQGSMFKALEMMRQGGAISEEQQAAANNAVNQIYGQEYYTEQASPEEQAMNEIKAFELLGINKDKDKKR